MITKGTKLIIKYEYFTDKDLQYVINLVHEEFNKELAERLNWKPITRYQELQAPLEIKEISTGNSLFLDLTSNIELIVEYLIRIGVGSIIIQTLRELSEDELKEIIKKAIRKAIDRFKRRRRKDHIEDLSTSRS